MKVQFHSHRFGGFRVPVEPGDFFSLWTPDHEAVLQLDAAVVLELLAARVREARLVRLIMEAKGDPLAFERLEIRPVEAPELPKLPSPEEQRLEARRDAYRAGADSKPKCGYHNPTTGRTCACKRPCKFHQEVTR